jgi:hypothetical protein
MGAILITSYGRIENQQGKIKSVLVMLFKVGGNHE